MWQLLPASTTAQILKERMCLVMTVSPEKVARLPGGADDIQGVRIKILTFPSELACMVMAKGLSTTTTPFFSSSGSCNPG